MIWTSIIGNIESIK